jgi:hypothetical protein
MASNPEQLEELEAQLDGYSRRLERSQAVWVEKVADAGREDGDLLLEAATLIGQVRDRLRRMTEELARRAAEADEG